MAKGDDAVNRRRNKTLRKRMRGSESAVSARVASIIASKHRRKAGKRRICEGMCFSLPTPDDPFNDRQGKKKSDESCENEKMMKKKRNTADSGKSPKDHDGARKNKNRKSDGTSDAAAAAPELKGTRGRACGDSDYATPSKFLVICLNAIQDAWKDNGTYNGEVHKSLLASRWGIEFWKHCSAGANVLNADEACTSREQVAWLVAIATDMISLKDSQGQVLPSPFLLFLVPTEEKALQVMTICRPLKGLGIHTVNLRPSASVEHQVNGKMSDYQLFRKWDKLKWRQSLLQKNSTRTCDVFSLKVCEPEFLISTPERLLELISLSALEISGVSLLVIDGLKDFVNLSLVEKLNSIRESLSGKPQVVVFSNSNDEGLSSIAENLIGGPISRLSISDENATL